VGAGGADARAAAARRRGARGGGSAQGGGGGGGGGPPAGPAGAGPQPGRAAGARRGGWAGSGRCGAARRPSRRRAVAATRSAFFRPGCLEIATHPFESGVFQRVHTCVGFRAHIRTLDFRSTQKTYARHIISSIRRYARVDNVRVIFDIRPNECRLGRNTRLDVPARVGSSPHT